MGSKSVRGADSRCIMRGGVAVRHVYAENPHARRLADRMGEISCGEGRLISREPEPEREPGPEREPLRGRELPWSARAEPESTRK